ncbi:MAG: hypothetical protein JSV91_08185 [Phycisphaerales bacterium]|nr:MAG: hypothetical protein JSV91_08185 [Phycisphaerales bacterium]
MAKLQTTPNSPRLQIAAMEAMDVAPPSETYLEVLHRIVWYPGYNVEVREAAVNRLADYDLPGLKTTLRRRLPNMAALEGRKRLCEIIAERGWIDLTPALVSGWAVSIVGQDDDLQRPEAKALAALHGEANLSDVVFDLMVQSNRVAEQGLRTRCWNLLHHLGQRDRLVSLLRDHEPPADDAMLVDLHAGAVELGLVPYNREEILWLRKLRQPENAEFWAEAVAAASALEESLRAELEIRDLAIVVSARRHDPELLKQTRTQLLERLRAGLKGRKHHDRGSRFDDTIGSRKDRLYEWREEVTWGDLAAMLIAVRAIQVPQVVEHLFDYARRDREDETTEYGGVIRLDEKGRFEILEFPPRIRRHDQQFNAPQEMLDAAYTALFHFHLHVQRLRNAEYAAPGFGDLNYADNVRANCLVFTSVNRTTMNVDYYRHGRVVVDLGEIHQR